MFEQRKGKGRQHEVTPRTKRKRRKKTKKNTKQTKKTKKKKKKERKYLFFNNPLTLYHFFSCDGKEEKSDERRKEDKKEKNR